MKKLILILCLLLICPTVYAENMNYIELTLTDTNGILEYHDPLQIKSVDCNFTFKGSYNTITLKSPAFDTTKSVEKLSIVIYPDNGYMSIIAYTKLIERKYQHEGTKLTIVNGENTAKGVVIEGYLYIRIPIYWGTNKFIVIAQEGNMILTLTNYFILDLWR